MSSDPSTPHRPRLWMVLGAAGVSLLAAALVAWMATRLLAPPRFHGTAWEPPEPAADFRLTDHTGRPARLADYRGRAVLLFFGYANCPDVCPLTLQRLQRVLGAMEADTAEVRVLLVSVDPRRDTPEVLARYVSGFAPYVTGLTGDSATLAGVRKSYYAYAEPAAAAPPAAGAEHAGHAPVAGAFAHTPQVYGIDREGRLRVLLPVDGPDEPLVEDLRTLLRL